MTARYPDKKSANRRVLTVIGNRPQFIKAAAVSGPLREVAAEVLVHTGQHYDDALSQIFFDELGLPRPEHRLDLGGGSHTSRPACGRTTARCPKSSTACWRTMRATSCCARRRSRPRSSAAKRSAARS